ncbi:MAG TPA: hypothetical protein VFB80_10525 [Pirellulaceae bacterium]|nr:hypothetical protein [Pirellulaceae bacterium]
MTAIVQHNLYKGTTPRCWVRLRFAAADGSLHERELLADTGSPCAVVLSQTDLALLLRAAGPNTGSNFGSLTGGWLELSMPELGLTQLVLGYGSDAVWQAVQSDCPDFAGLVGLPLLRLVEYGGDSAAFWLKPTSSQIP